MLSSAPAATSSPGVVAEARPVAPTPSRRPPVRDRIGLDCNRRTNSAILTFLPREGATMPLFVFGRGWRRRLHAILAVAVILFPFSSVSQEATNVQDLYRVCQTPLWEFEEASCAGFISGVAEQMGFSGHTATLPRRNGGLANGRDRKLLSTMSACIPRAVSPGAVIQAFLDWAEKHPEKWTTPRQTGVMQALREAWPCKAQHI
jgi:hypothetical protein